MLRAADKRMRLGERLPQVFGARGVQTYPADLHPGRLSKRLPPVAGPVAWFDPSVVSTITLADKQLLSNWADRSGNGYDGVQGTGSLQPRVFQYPSLMNGLPLTYFDGTRQLDSNAPADDRTETSFFVGMVDSLSDYRTIIGSNTSGGRQIRFDQTTGKVTCNFEGFSGLFTTSTLACSVGTPFVLAVNLTATTWECRLTGNTTESGSNSGTFNTPRTSCIGANRYAGGERFSGFIGEILIYGTSLTSGQMDETINYLRGKWGI